MANTGIDAVREVISVSELAKKLNITRGAVAQWRDRIPAERIIEIEKITGISRAVLRPDLYHGDIA